MAKRIHMPLLEHLLGKLYILRNYKFFYSPPKYPKHMDIEVTNVCNYACLMCPSETQERKKQFMEMTLYKKIIDEMDELHVKNIWLQVLGEPLLHPQIIEMVKYAKSKKNIKRVGFSTNCSKLSPEMSRNLILSGVDRLIFAIDGATKKTYESIRIGGDFDKVIENVNEFIRIRKELGQDKPSIRLQFIQMQDNCNEVSDFKKLWEDKLLPSDQIAIKPCDVWAGQVKDRRIENQSAVNINFEAWKSRQADKDIIEKLRSFILYRTPCWGFLFTGGSILSNGDITVCGMDVDSKLKIGNAHSDSIREVWCGDKMKEYRNNHLKLKSNIYTMCKECPRSYKSICINQLKQ